MEKVTVLKRVSLQEISKGEGVVYKGRPLKSQIFKPPLPLSGCVRIFKTTPPRTSASGYSNYYFYTFLVLPNSSFSEV